MKRWMLLSLIGIFAHSAFAQAPPEKVKQMKIAFYNERLALTEQEKNVFWPLYEQFEKERRQLLKSKVNAAIDNRNLESMSTAELNQYIESLLEIREKEAALQRRYMTEFRKVLPLVKVARLVTLEEEFRLYLMRTAREKSGSPPVRPWGK